MSSREIRILEEAKRWEVERFPDKFKAGWDGDIYAPPNRTHFYFGPSYHIKTRLVTPEVIDDLAGTSKRLLSVGSGAAFLERFLVEELGIDQARVVLSDLYTDDLPEQFRRHQFDIDEEWPDLSERFDYIIFPESVNCNLKYNGDLANQAALKHYITNAYQNLKEVGQIRINGHCQPEERINVVKRGLERNHSDLQLISSPSLIVVQRYPH